MRRTAIMTAVGLLLAMAPTATLATQAGAADTATVTIIDLNTYAADHDNPGYICLDGTKIDGPETDGVFNVTDSSAALTVTPGNHTINFVPESAWAELGCDAPTGVEGTFSVMAGDNVTVGVNDFGPSEDEQGGDLLIVWKNMNDCIEQGHARIGVRNAATTRTEGGLSTVSVKADVDGTATTIAGNLGYGDQSKQEPSAPIGYTGISAVADMGGDELASAGNLGLEVGDGQMLYVYGGGDGNVGVFVAPTMHPGLCDLPSTTTTSTTSTIPPATQAQTVTPKFTG